MTIAAAIRKQALHGRALWSSLAFFALLLACVVMSAVTLMLATTWVGPVLLLGGELNAVAGTGDVGQWLRDIVHNFAARRGDAIPAPRHWLAIATIAALLFAVGLSSFRRPNGESLLAEPRATEAVRRLLERFGYFRDIRYGRSLDIVAAGRQLFVPQGHVLRLLQGRPSDREQANLTFFMAHEYVHALLRDNLAHSLFRVIFFWTAGVTGTYLALFVMVTVMISIPLAGNPILFFGLSLCLATLIVIAVLVSMYSVIVAYAKAREFFADEAAFFQIDVDVDPYRTRDQSQLPSPLAGWSRSVTPYERRCHREGSSPYARNLLTGTLVLHMSLRTLFLLVVPSDVWAAVLVFDAAMLGSMALLLRSLPPRPGGGQNAPLVPRLLALLVLVALFLSSAGIAGYLQLTFDIQLISIERGLALTWPPIIAAILLTFGMLRSFWIRTIKDEWTMGTQSRAPWSRLLFQPFLLPAWILRTLLLIVTLVLAAGALSASFGYVAAGRTASDIAIGLLASLVLLAVGSVLYRNMIWQSRLSIGVEALIGGSALFGVTGMIAILITGLVDIPAEQMMPATAQLLSAPTSGQLHTALTCGTGGAALYIVAVLVEYWARLKNMGRYLRAGPR